MHKISVIIPTYNREKFIKRSIESVLIQEGQGIDFDIDELIVIDDGSTDNTESIVKNIDSPKLIYHRFSNNRGALEAWDAGIELAKSEWIAFQDSDDIWHKEKLRKQIKFADEHKDICLITHPFKAFFDDGKETVTRVVEQEDIIKSLAIGNFIGTPTILVKKDALISVGGFNKKITALQDWDFAIRFADKYKIGMIPDVLLDVDMTVEGMSRDASKYYESRCMIIAENKDILLKHGCFDDAVRSLLTHAKNNGVLDKVGKMLELNLKK